MCIAFLGVTLDEENLASSLEPADAATPPFDWDGFWEHLRMR
jgi:hypothetical protein